MLRLAGPFTPQRFGLFGASRLTLRSSSGSPFRRSTTLRVVGMPRCGPAGTSLCRRSAHAPHPCVRPGIGEAGARARPQRSAIDGSAAALPDLTWSGARSVRRDIESRRKYIRSHPSGLSAEAPRVRCDVLSQLRTCTD
jgi:hypothetical protein